VDYFLDKGFHPNSFIIGPVLWPKWQDIRNFDDWTQYHLALELRKRIDAKPGYLLEESYKNMLKHLDLKPFDKDLHESFEQLLEMDRRRGTDSRKIFREVLECSPD